MNVGIMMALGSSLEDQAKSGQDVRLIKYYLEPYSKHFEQVTIFSYGKVVRKDLPKNLTVLPNTIGMHRSIYAFLLPRRWSKQLRQCHVIRVMQMTGAIPAILAKKMFGIPFVATFGYRYSDLAKQNGLKFTTFVLKQIERAGLKHADCIIVTNAATEKYILEDRHADPKKIVRIPNGVDCTSFIAIKDYKKVENVLSIGRLEKEKNFGALIEAMGILPGKKPILTLIGRGSQEKELIELAKSKGVQLVIKGTLPYNEIAAAYQKSDLFVIPSFSEGQSKVLLEAMGCALPCIASPCEGNKQLIQHHKNGLIATGFTAQDFVQALKDFIDSESLRKQMGQSARVSIESDYNIFKNVSKEIEILKQIARKDATVN